MDTQLEEIKITLKDNPEVYLSPEEVAAAKSLIAKINTRFPIKMERSHNQPSCPFKVDNWSDIPKTQYKGIISSDKNSKTEIITDGVIKYGKAWGSIVADMQNYEVSNYNYILVLHHFPSNDPNIPESKYQSLVTYNVILKYYIQTLLGMSIG